MAMNPTETSPTHDDLDVATIKKDFPLLARDVHGKPIVYLDSAATSQKPTSVLDTLDTYYRTINANVHRGVYFIAEEATAESPRTSSVWSASYSSPPWIITTTVSAWPRAARTSRSSRSLVHWAAPPCPSPAT